MSSPEDFPKPKLRSIGDYEITASLGSGTFATVVHGVHRITRNDVAIKIIPKCNFNDPSHLTRFQRELDIFRSLDHQFIADFYQYLEDNDNFYLVMEFVSNGNLLDYINDNGQLSEGQARHFFSQLISVLEYLHLQKNIAHRDLKAENLLLDRNLNIRLIDFGLSNIFTTDNPYLQTACGSPAYASPEMIRGQKYTTSSDIWSSGVLLYAMINGELPFNDDNTQRLLQKIIFSEPKYSAALSPSLVDLLKLLLRKDPKERIPLEKIKEHPWFANSGLVPTMDGHYGVAQRWRIRGDNPSEDIPFSDDTKVKMESFGIDCTNLREELIMDVSDCKTSCYKMLYKEKITDEMASLSAKKPRHALSWNISAGFGPEMIIPQLPKIAGEEAAKLKMSSSRLTSSRQRVPLPSNLLPGRKPINSSPQRAVLTIPEVPNQMKFRKRASSFQEKQRVVQKIQ